MFRFVETKAKQVNFKFFNDVSSDQVFVCLFYSGGFKFACNILKSGMEQAEGQSSGNEENAPYTVVVQIPNPYGDSPGKT